MATSVPPFLQFYRLFYTLVIGVAVRRFKKHSSIKAVYLRRGGARRKFIPAVSDLDFGVFVGKMSEPEWKALLRDYAQLAKHTAILDHFLEVYEVETFREKVYAPQRQYRFMEGKARWALLYGHDFLADLPHLSVDEMHDGLYVELNIWWTIFAWQQIQEVKYWNETITQNTVCYKAVSEALKMTMALGEGHLTFDRAEALARAKLSLTSENRAIVEKLEVVERENFRVPNPGVVEETKQFLLTFLNRFFEKTPKFHANAIKKEVSRRCDCLTGELFFGLEERTHISQLLNHVKERWGPGFMGAYLSTGLSFDLDELLLMLRVDPENLPTIADLRNLHSLHHEAHPETRSRIHLYLLLPNGAFQVDVDYYQNGRRSILCPSVNPEVFTLIQERAFTLVGEPYQALTSPVVTKLEWGFLKERKAQCYDYIQRFCGDNQDPLFLIRGFWKTIQAVLMSRAIKKSEILYPLTLPAIERAMASEGMSLSKELQALSQAYRSCVRGEVPDLMHLAPAAIAFLKKIESW